MLLARHTPPRRSTLFPYTTLFRSLMVNLKTRDIEGYVREAERRIKEQVKLPENYLIEFGGQFEKDRKSTRLNSSHRCTSYAVFCLKNKNKQYKCLRRYVSPYRVSE